MSMFHNARVCIAVSTPLAMVTGPTGKLIYDPISPLWWRARSALSVPTNINLTDIMADGMEVGDARSRVAARCLEMKPRPEFLFFLDSDVLVPQDALTKLFYRARCRPDYDLYCGVYCCKWSNPPDPLIYGENGQGAIWDWAVGDILTTESHGVKSCHMGLTLLRVSAFQKLLDAGLAHGDGTDQGDEPFFCTINTSETKGGTHVLRRGTEDIYFCSKLVKAGGKVLVDTGVLAGHHDKGTGITYGLPLDDGPVKRAGWLPGKDGKRKDEEELVECGTCAGTGDLSAKGGEPKACEVCGGDGRVPVKLALDLGAGGERRQWAGHKTFTTDLRADTKPDYVQDTRWLTLPDDHFDLVASSHHLEHIPRWEQERAWAEVYRVCKPGGAVEMILPNAEWAAHKMVQGEVDEHVVNVLYGAQEAHGYARELNTHFFPYTPAVGRALAEAAGFTDVATESFKQREELGYNLIIRGKKPLTEATTADTSAITQEAA
jgi:SAM-dependent methyltransferase